MPDTNTEMPRVPESRAVSKKRTRISLVWLVPIVAAAAGVWVAVTRILGEGPKITLVFRSADGLDAGKTKIRYNGVDIGVVTSVRLSDDHRQVITTAQMEPKTESFLVEDTRFWVVRPRVSGASITGLGTLISGAYIGTDIGHSKKTSRHFTALDAPPIVTADVPGRYFVLKTPDLGSLDAGTPLFFRRLQVGEVTKYDLASDGTSLTVKIFVRAPFDQYVTSNTRFWNASGIDVALTASGITVQTQSLLSILAGGIAFETPSTGPVLPAAEQDTEFTLFRDRVAAFSPAARDPQEYVLVFDDSVRGLAPGAPVEFRGVAIGEVASIDAQVDAKTLEFTSTVTIRLDSQRLGVKFVDVEPGEDMRTVRRKLFERLVSRGVRAQLRTGSLLTGALFVSFDYFPDAPPATVDWSQTPVRFPTIPGQLQVIEARLTGILDKINEMPLKGIGEDLRKALVEVDRTLVSARGTFESARGTLDTGRGTLDNANKLIEPNSVLGAELANTLSEVSRAARSVRVLADFLERHPEALIRGKTGEAK